MWLLFWQFLILACTFAHASIGIMNTTEASANLANVLCLMYPFLGGVVIASPSIMPGFCILMYRLSPFTYWL